MSAGAPWWRDAVFYQVYVRSFADSDGDGLGDLPGITSRLRYLRDLGVDAVWITPFYPSPQHDAGYDVADYRDESGASAAHRAGLSDHARETAVMRAWTGRPARGLRNAFSDAYDASAPNGYPALHHLTRPLRRAAAAAADAERVNLWAGTGFRAARAAPAAEILAGLG